MKAVVMISYHYYLVPVEVAVRFLESAQELKQDYNAKTGYTYSEVAGKDHGEIEVKIIDETQIQRLESPPEKALKRAADVHVDEEPF